MIGDVYSHQVQRDEFRLVGGAVERRRPWSVLIKIYRGQKNERKEFCEGTLINHWWGSMSMFYSILFYQLARYVLTAAHCLCSPTAAERKKEGWCDGGKNIIEIDSK